MLIGAAEAWSRTRTGLASGEYHSLESTTPSPLNTWWQFTSLSNWGQVTFETDKAVHLKKQKDNLSARLERERVLARALLPLSLGILSLLREHERLGISALENLTGANKNRLKVRLRELTAWVRRLRTRLVRPGLEVTSEKRLTRPTRAEAILKAKASYLEES
jgi:hypothetical protein